MKTSTPLAMLALLVPLWSCSGGETDADTTATTQAPVGNPMDGVTVDGDRVVATHLRIDGPRLQAILAHPSVPPLRELDLSDNKLDGAAVTALLQSPKTAQIEVLDLSRNADGDGMLAALVGSPRLATLHTLRMEDADVTAVGVQKFGPKVDAPQLAVYFGNDQIGDEGAMALAQTPGLRSVQLHACQISTWGAMHLVSKGKISRIDLSWNREADLVGLTQVSPQVAELHMHISGLTGPGLAALAAAPAPALRKFAWSSRYRMQPADFDKLAAAPWFGQLSLLELPLAESDKKARAKFEKAFAAGPNRKLDGAPEPPPDPRIRPTPGDDKDQDEAEDASPDDGAPEAGAPEDGAPEGGSPEGQAAP